MLEYIISNMPHVIKYIQTGSLVYAPDNKNYKDYDYAVILNDDLRNFDSVKNKLKDIREYLEEHYKEITPTGIVTSYSFGKNSHQNYILNTDIDIINRFSFSYSEENIGVDLFLYPKDYDLNKHYENYYKNYKPETISKWMNKNKDYKGRIITF